MGTDVQVPGVEHSAITSLGSNHVAVMGSLEEGGFLHLVCFTHALLTFSGCLISAIALQV